MELVQEIYSRRVEGLYFFCITFLRLIHAKTATQEDVGKPEGERDDNESPPTDARISQVDRKILDNTASHKLFEQLMSTYYIPMEIWYTRTIMDKV